MINNTSILLSSKSQFEASIAKLSKRAGKLGVAAPVITFGNIIIRNVVNSDNVEMDLEFIEVAIEEVDVKLNGWEVIGVVEIEEGVTYTRSFQELPVEFRTTSMTRCDHCHTKHARNSVVIIRNEAGEYLQVGKSCLKDFTGHATALSIASYWSLLAEVVEEFEDEYMTCSGVPQMYSVEKLLSIGAMSVRNYGYVSKSMAEERGMGCTTADDIRTYIFSTNNKNLPNITEEDKATAATIIEWFSNANLDTTSDFMFNLTNIMDAGYCSAKRIGILSAIFAVHAKATMESVDYSKSVWFGVEKDKIEMNVEVVGVYGYSTQFGYMNIITMLNEAGNVLVWKTGSASDAFSKGASLKIKATIKGHDEFRGVKQTSIIRVKAI